MRARYADSRESQRCGRSRNDVGETCTACPPVYIGVRIMPISPISWGVGSHETVTSGGRSRSAAWISRQLATRLRCVTMIPFGSPVEPDVYWRKAISEGWLTASPHAPDASGSASVASHEHAASSGDNCADCSQNLLRTL